MPSNFKCFKREVNNYQIILLIRFAREILWVSPTGFKIFVSVLWRKFHDECRMYFQFSINIVIWFKCTISQNYYHYYHEQSLNITRVNSYFEFVDQINIRLVKSVLL